MTLGISKCFAKSEFQTFEPNSEIGAVNEPTIEFSSNIVAALMFIIFFILNRIANIVTFLSICYRKLAVTTTPSFTDVLLIGSLDS